MNKKDIIHPSKEDDPPIFRSWNKIYGLVFFIHALFVLIFYLFTKAFE